MTNKFTPTAAICVVAGLGAALGLARPAPSAPDPVANAGYEVNQDGGAADPNANDAALAKDEQADDAGSGDQAGRIDIADFAFGSFAPVGPGAVVAVNNSDTAPHTVTAEDGSFDTGTIDATGASSFVAPSAPGTYAFICSIHPAMEATLIVEE